MTDPGGSAAAGRATQRRPVRSRAERLRTVTYLMLFRVGLVTVLLVATVLVHALGPAPEELAGPFSLFILGLIVLTYTLTLIYARVLPRVHHPEVFAYGQMGADLAVITVLVHATGGAESAFVFLYALSIISATVVQGSRGILGVAAGAAVLYLTVAILGATGLLPPVIGQRVLPTATAQGLGRAVVFNLSAMGAVAVLASNLATQVQRAGERLADQQDRFSDLAAQSEDVIRCLTSGLVTADRQGRVTTFNLAAEEITGLPRAGALGRPLAEVLPPLDELTVTAVGADRAEVAITRPDGTRVPLGVSVSALTDRVGDVVGRILNFQNLAELKRMEQAVKRNERMAAVGQLAATMAHEIRNPLASISGSIELLRAGARDADDRQLIDIVLREVERLNRLIGELLDFARPRQLSRSPLDLAVLLQEALTVFEHERPEALQVEVAAAAPIWVDADAPRLKQLLWNLLRNASEAMPEGGVIRVALSSGTTADGRQAFLRIADQGPGIPPEEAEHIFEPFFTTKAQGTGLGLAMVQRIATDHGGAVEVESAPGTGTTFVVTLPATEPPRGGGHAAEVV